MSFVEFDSEQRKNYSRLNSHHQILPRLSAIALSLSKVLKGLDDLIPMAFGLGEIGKEISGDRHGVFDVDVIISGVQTSLEHLSCSHWISRRSRIDSNGDRATHLQYLLVPLMAEHTELVMC